MPPPDPFDPKDALTAKERLILRYRLAEMLRREQQQQKPANRSIHLIYFIAIALSFLAGSAFPIYLIAEGSIILQEIGPLIFKLALDILDSNEPQ